MCRPSETPLAMTDRALTSLFGWAAEQAAEQQGTLIVEYYQDERRDRIGRRKALADALGLRREALANRAQRLRDKLEQCVRRCFNEKAAI